MNETASPTLMSKLSLKLLAFFLGAMSWYLIQDAIRIENAQLKGFEPLSRIALTNAVKRLENVPVTVLSKPGIWEWQVDPPAVSTVWLEVPEESLAQVEEHIGMVRVFVDGSVIEQQGSYAMPVRVYLPVDLGVKVATEPPLVQLTAKPAMKGTP